MDSNEDLTMKESILKTLYLTAIASGEVETDGLSKSELRSKCAEYLLSVYESDAELEWVTDHRSDLLKEARSFSKSGKHELSVVFYALWLEHWINHIYSHVFRQRELTNLDYKEMVRSLNIPAKTGWFLKLLGLPEFDTDQLKVFKKIIDGRNGFVHYKWQTYNPDISESHKTVSPELMEEAEFLISYLSDYEAKLIYKGFTIENV